jgi:nucleotide-binding universal stress UspA family protein
MRLLALRTVLVATDLDIASIAGIETARSLSTAAGAALHVVHATQDGATPATPDDVDRFLERAGVALDARHVHVLQGDPAHTIRVLADRIAADVIVLGPHRERASGERGASLGSTALAVVTDSFAPCLVTRTTLRVPLARVVVGVDRSDAARGALVVGLSWASALRAPTSAADGSMSTMLVIHVDRSSDGAASPRASGAATGPLDAELRRIRAEAGPWARVAIDDLVLRAGDPAAAITGAADERGADLIVVGTRGLGHDRSGRLGSVAATLVRISSTPVLLVPPAVWMSYAPT